MTAKQVSEQLRIWQERYKDKQEPTLVADLSQFAKDMADVIDNLQAQVDYVMKLPNCNTCINPQCQIRPAWGERVRYNCYGYTGAIYFDN